MDDAKKKKPSTRDMTIDVLQQKKPKIFFKKISGLPY